jgi:hypothetical protein
MSTVTSPIQREPELAVHSMTNTALTCATYDNGGQQFVNA